MASTVTHRSWGWRIRRRIRPCGDAVGNLNAGALCVDVRLTNLGDADVTTPYMVGNLFNVQDAPVVGPGYSLSFALPGAARFRDVPGAKPLEAIAILRLREDGKTSQIMFSRGVPEKERAMASFPVPAHKWNGAFSLTVPADDGMSIVVTHTMSAPTPKGGGGRRYDDPVASHKWYGFNGHATRRAIAPRPYSLLTLPKGTTLEWSHRYDFSWRHDF